MRLSRVFHLTLLLLSLLLPAGSGFYAFPQEKIQPLIKKLSDPDPTVRGEALRALENKQKAEVVPAVLAALEKADRDTAQRLLKVLEEFPDTSEIEPMIELAKRQDGLGTELFSRLGEPGAKVLLGEIATRCEEIIEHTSFAEWAGLRLAGMGPAARILLRKALDDPNPCVRRASLWGLGISDDDNANGTLNLRELEQDATAVVSQLGDSDARVRELATEVLTPSREVYGGWAEIQGEAIQPLTDFYHSQRDAETRFRTIQVLNLYSCAPLMEEAKKDQDIRIREIAERYQPPTDGEAEDQPVEAAATTVADANALQRLMSSKSPRDRAEAAEKLGKSGKIENTAHLVALLKDSNGIVRAKAAEGLGALNEPIVEAGPHAEADVADSGPALFEALTDSEAAVRAAAAKALVDIYPASEHDSADSTGLSADHQQLLARLKPLASVSDQKLARVGALAYAHFLQPEDLRAAIVLTHHAAPDVRQEAAEAVARAQKPESVQPLIALFKDTDAAVRERAARGLYLMIVFAGADTRTKLVEQLPFDPLLEALKDSATRWSAVGLFELKKDQRSINALLDLLPVAPGNNEAQILRTVVQIGDKKASLLLLDHLKNDPQPNRYAIYKAIVDLHDERIVEPLLEFAETPKGAWLKREIVLLSFHDARVVPELLEQLKDQHEDVRMNAAKQLGGFQDGRIAPALMATLKDEAWDVQYAAAKSLGQLGDRRAIPPLVAMLDYNPGAAAMALSELKATEVLPRIAELASQTTTKNRDEVVAGIGEFQAEQAVDPLVATMNSASKSDCVLLEAVAKELGKFETEKATAGLRELYFKAWPADACPNASRLAAQLLMKRGAGLH